MNDNNMPVIKTIEVIKNGRKKVENETSYQTNEIKYLNTEELEKLFNYLKEHNQFYYTLCLMLFETASRVSEILNAKYSDINKYEKTIKLRNMKQRRNIYKVQILSDNLLYNLLLHKEKYKLSDNDYLFAKKPNSEPVRVQCVNHYLRKVGRIVLNKPVHSHMYRHSRAIQALNMQMPITMVQKMLGHANIINTTKYLAFANVDVQNYVRKINQTIQY